MSQHRLVQLGKSLVGWPDRSGEATVQSYSSVYRNVNGIESSRTQKYQARQGPDGQRRGRVYHETLHNGQRHRSVRDLTDQELAEPITAPPPRPTLLYDPHNLENARHVYRGFWDGLDDLRGLVFARPGNPFTQDPFFKDS